MFSRLLYTKLALPGNCCISSGSVLALVLVVSVCVCACVRAFVRACVRACVVVCVCVCVCVLLFLLLLLGARVACVTLYAFVCVLKFCQLFNGKPRASIHVHVLAMGFIPISLLA